ncbi:MAG: beta-eliminating lyase-related protein [Candidatus Cryptobacteroides sp.]|nr:beta-eliminating lyase-related protein [Candidatus Cryptobacteroides sp.]
MFACIIALFQYFCSMYSFTCDYTEGAHPEILRALTETNMQQEPGYGEDSFCASAKKRIREATGCPDADIFFLVGGTQTNSTVIDGLLEGCQGVLAVQTGHIAVHEAGAIEFCGHKVLTLPQHQGKMDAGELKAWLDSFYADGTYPHMVQPGMVYISFPTEYGTIYSRAELEGIRDVCKQYGLPLFIDGASLGYGLASPAADVTLRDIAGLCDVFYIGGTKVGALCGEAVVFPKGNAPKHFFTHIKMHGALLAKGRLLGIQFDTLFTNGLYMQISAHAIRMAMKLKTIFAEKGIPFYIDSPTNQQFPILTSSQMAELEGKIAFEIWERLPDGRAVTRFATSWATNEESIKTLQQLIG